MDRLVDGDRLKEWLLEDDDSLTAVIVRPDGTWYELRGCVLASVDDPADTDGITSLPLTIEQLEPAPRAIEGNLFINGIEMPGVRVTANLKIKPKGNA